MAKFSHDLFETCLAEGYGLEKMGAIEDLIVHQYLNESEENFTWRLILFQVCYVVPFLIALLYPEGTDPTLIRVCCSLCILTQLYMLYKEIHG